MCQTHPSRSGQLRSRPCFHFVFRRPDKGSRMLFCLHLATCAPSLKAESPLPDQRAVKWRWKTALSTSSPQLSLSLPSATHCQIYSLLCERGHKNQQKQLHAMVIYLSGPSAALMRLILRVSAVKGPSYELSRHQLSDLSWFLLVETIFCSIHLTQFPSKSFPPADRLSQQSVEEQSDPGPRERALEWQIWPTDDNARRKSPWVKTLGGGTFWEHSLWKGARYVVMPHRLQRTSILGLIFILYLLNKCILNTYNVPDLLQSIVKTCTLFLSCYCSVVMSCLTLCDPMDCRMPGFPVLHYLPEFVQTHVHCVDIPALVQKNRWSEHSLTHSF